MFDHSSEMDFPILTITVFFCMKFFEHPFKICNFLFSNLSTSGKQMHRISKCLFGCFRIILQYFAACRFHITHCRQNISSFVCRKSLCLHVRHEVFVQFIFYYVQWPVTVTWLALAFVNWAILLKNV